MGSQVALAFSTWDTPEACTQRRPHDSRHVQEIMQGDKEKGQAEDGGWGGGGDGRFLNLLAWSLVPSGLHLRAPGMPACTCTHPDSSREAEVPGFSAPSRPFSPSQGIRAEKNKRGV